MKKLYIFFTILLALTACSSENIAIDNEEPEVEPIEEVAGITIKIDKPVRLGDENITRSSLYYDDDQNIMDFSWADDDAIGVFPYTVNKNPDYSSQQKFTQIEDNSKSQYIRTFKTPDEQLSVTPNAQYIACLPYFEGYTSDYTTIPVDYTGQRQREPVAFCDYWGDQTKYKKSQPKASAHLSKYDFQCTGITQATPFGGIRFNMNRMGAIVRFWIVIDPENNYVYDELQLVNRTKQFTTKAKMDAKECTLISTGQSHVVNLQLGNVGEGFDMTDKTKDGTITPFYDYYEGEYTGYLMLYMMLAPIDLTGDDVENSFIYLVAHKKSGDTTEKHYFKSEGLSKPNLTPNAFYQWTVYPDEDKPIEMKSITVEEWRTGTSFDNGEDGKGTEKW